MKHNTNKIEQKQKILSESFKMQTETLITLTNLVKESSSPSKSPRNRKNDTDPYDPQSGKSLVKKV